MSQFQNIPIDLIESIHKGECVLFLASGLSSDVVRSNGKALPSWKSLLEELLTWAETKRVPFNSDPSEIKDMIDKGNLLMAAEELQELINPNEFGEFLNEIFRDRAVKPTDSHNLLTKIPFKSILTTNYDALIEGAYTITSGGQIPKKFTQLDLNAALTPLRKNEFFIFKMHGDIDRPNTIVLGTRSYNNLIYKSPEYLSFLETLFTTHTVLFMGFGGSDPDLDYLIDRLSTIFSRTLNKHFLLAPKTKFNFTEKRRLLLDKRLEVIEYDMKNNHEELHLFIKSLHNFFNVPQSKKDTKKVPINVMIIHSMSSKSHDEEAKRITQFIDSLEGYHVISWSNLIYYLDTKTKENRIKDLIKNDSEFENPSLAIILINEFALKSISFENEIELALLKQIERKLKIIPIILGNLEIPYKLRNYQVLRLPSKPTDKDLSKLIPILNTIAN